MSLIMCPDKILELIESEENLRHLSLLAALSLSSPSALETGGRVLGEARGDPWVLCLPSPAARPSLVYLSSNMAFMWTSLVTMFSLSETSPGTIGGPAMTLIKMVLNSFCPTSNIRAGCEVYGEFPDLIPVEALGEDKLQQGQDKGYFQTSRWSFLHQRGTMLSNSQS